VIDLLAAVYLVRQIARYGRSSYGLDMYQQSGSSI